MGYLLYLMVMWLQNGIKWANILSLFGTATFYLNFGIPLLVPYTKDFERITQF